MNKLNNTLTKERWNTINWRSVNADVFKWQKKIYSASKEGNIKIVRQFQHRLLNSTVAKLVAIRRVTQDNMGKRTAGVDNIKTLKPEERILFVSQLKFPTKAKPLRRVWIPKPGKAEKRPLGIPTIKDRCLQTLLKLAMEPEWEARFERNSYGFRPGRNAHDAVSPISKYIQFQPKYVLDADIPKCFDKINYEALLEKIGFKGKYRKQIQYWLKAGILDKNVFMETEYGIPQGGIISPLLANIALHGMEQYLKTGFDDIPLYYGSGAKMRGVQKRRDSLAVIRYAADLVIMHNNLQVVLQCKKRISIFLKNIGLEISEKKTRLTHTLKLESTDTSKIGFDGKIGFDFLGFTIKQVITKHRSVTTPNKSTPGFKTLVFPSKTSIKKHQAHLHDLVLKQGKMLNQTTLIQK